MTVATVRTTRWIEDALAPARARVLRVPTRDAIERIRRRTLGEITRRTERIAA